MTGASCAVSRSRGLHRALACLLAEIEVVLDSLPRGKAVSAKTWARAAAARQAMVDERNVLMTRLRDQMGCCIGSGSLSLDSCPLYNGTDRLGSIGPGPRWWAGQGTEREEI